MKIQLAISDAHYDEVFKLLTENGIEIDDNAEYILVEKNRFISHLTVRHPVTGERTFLPVEQIISIESFGHTVEVTAVTGKYTTSYRLFQLATLLDPQRYIRISNSVIIARMQIRKIAPAITMKFTLFMKDGRKFEVTRGYYQSFKDALGI